MEANVQRMLEVRVGIIPLASALPLCECKCAFMRCSNNPLGKRGEEVKPLNFKTLYALHCVQSCQLPPAALFLMFHTQQTFQKRSKMCNVERGIVVRGKGLQEGEKCVMHFIQQCENKANKFKLNN